jgi:hypothetical protein
MYYQDLIPEALDIVFTWDVPDEVFIRAVTDRAMMSSGTPPEEILEGTPETL